MSQPQVARTTGCTKKSFTTSAAAESFASELQRKYPTQARQSAYPCEDCPNWHLTTMDPVAHGMAESRSNLSSSANTSWAPGLHKDLQHLQTQIKEMHAEYVKSHGTGYGAIGDICHSLGIEDNYKKQTVRFYLIEIGVHKPNPKSVEGQRHKNNPSVESLESQEQQLERQLRDVQIRKQALIEAKAFKITNMLNEQEQPVVVVKKEGMSLVVSPEDAFVLVEKLEAHLSALPAR